MIPAYNPDERLLQLIGALVGSGLSHIVVVNDGSKSECDPIFERIQTREHCRVLRHAVNLGKGRALKTGLNYYSQNFPDSLGIITCDADGQHQVKDVVKVAEALRNNPGSLVIGARDFGGKVPLRSKLGNIITRVVFFLLVGKYLSDTQSGLRGIPSGLAPLLLRLHGEGYEYEMNMLIATKTHGISIAEERIRTIYLDNNRSSHFDPLIDSMKIYFLLMRFAFSSALASVLDFILFSICYSLSSSILFSIFVGRFTIGPFLNYSINRNFVFHHRGSRKGTLARYYLTATIMGIFAYVLIEHAASRMAMNVLAAKIIVETFLFIVSFTIQRDYVFAQRSPLDLLSNKALRG